jgi:DNA-damage-inducible protein J
MTTTNLNIRTDKEVKIAAEAIFSEFGLTMTAAINMFLRQSIRENGIPFELKLKSNKETTIAAIAEGRRLAKDPNAQGYTTMSDLKAALDE